MEASTSPTVRDEESAEPAGAEEVLAAAGLSASELSECVRVLWQIEQAQELGTLDPNASCLRSLRKVLSQLSKQTFAHLPQKSQLDENERKRAEKDRKRERRQRQLEADKRFQENTQLRASRLAKLQALEESEDVEKLRSLNCGTHEQLRIPDGPVSTEAEDCTTSPGDDGEQEYCRQQACYICKVRFSERHHFYSHLCPVCSALNFEKRHQARDLFGRTCLVTGARVKIGFQVATKLLRMGARVLATSRFPQDARKRYMAEPDAEQWLERLEIIGADFRFLGGVEAMCAQLKSREPFLDIIVNNACQTVRRPAAYYAHLLRDEAHPSNPSLPYGPYPSLARGPQFELEPQGPERAQQAEQAEQLRASSGFGNMGMGDSAALSQLLVLGEDKDLKEDALALPSGMRDVHGQQLDLRSTNSWLLKLGEVETPEAVEVFCINAMAPFIINSRLRGLLERSPHPDRYIINVSAMEGKFYRYKQPTHPHTNMAKAALNMMTRTSAEDLASNSGIFMNSVDTGWINDENPLPTAQRIAENHRFQTPIDEVDAAARILDPVLMGLDAVKSGHASCRGRVRKGGAEELGDGPVWGCFLKDYKLSEW